MTSVRTSISRLRPLFLALALAGAAISPAHAVSSSLHEFLKPAKPLDPEQAKEQRKAAARADAEKKRAQREAAEREAAEKGEATTAHATKSASVLDEDDEDTAAPAAAAAPAPATSARFNSDAGLHIEAAVRRLGLPPETAAQAAGLMVGMAGSSIFTKVLAPSQGGADALEMLAQDASNASVALLEQRYVLAERIGGYLRYGALAALLGGLAVLGLRRASGSGKRRSRIAANNNTSESSSMFKFSRLFGKGKKGAAAGASVTASPIIVDMNVLQDYAVNLLFARGRHDLTGCRDMVTANWARILETYFRTCESRGHWNKVERVSHLKCEQLEAWEDGELQYARLSVRWQALDYMVNFNRKPQDPGYVFEGKPNTLDDFAEDWTVVRRPGEGWLIDAMCPSAAPAR